MEDALKLSVIALLAVFALAGPAAWAGVQPSSKSHKKHASKVVKKPHPVARAKTKTPRVAAAPPAEEQGSHPDLRSTSAYVVDLAGRPLYAKNITAVQPI